MLKIVYISDYVVRNLIWVVCLGIDQVPVEEFLATQLSSSLPRWIG